MSTSEIFSRSFVHIWCYTLFVLIPISAGFALYKIVADRNSAWIKHRQPYAYFLWILAMALVDISWTVILYSLVGDNTDLDSIFWMFLITNVGLLLSLTLYFHRIWMVVYKSLFQKSIEALDMWDVQAIQELRSSKGLSNFFLKSRHTLGNPYFMSVVWFSMWLLAGGLQLWYGRGGFSPPGNHIETWDIVNVVFGGCIIGFALLMLAILWFFTVADNFKIRTELTMKCLLITFFAIFVETTWHTNFPMQNVLDKMITLFMVASGEVFLQILIMDYILYMNSRFCGDPSGYTINMMTVLKDEDLFIKFEEQQKREFNINNLNFLVSCIKYHRATMLQGQFGIGSISDESVSDIELLNWREITEEDPNPNEIARFIYSEFCVQGAPQKIKLDDRTAENLLTRMRNLSNVCNYAERDLFSEAFDHIHDQLDKESMDRFKSKLICPRGIHFHREASHSLGIPLLASRSEQ